MSQAVLPVAIGLCTILLASACSSSAQRDSVPPPAGAGREVGDNSSMPASNPPTTWSDQPSDGIVGAAGIAGQPRQKGSSDGSAVPSEAAKVERSAAALDKAMKKRGYKPATYRGERVYCRNETLTGSNLESKVCLTSRQIEELERSGKDLLNGNRQAGCVPTKSGCN